MAVDDHAINSLRTWFDLEYEELKKEWKSGQYGNLSECPLLNQHLRIVKL